MSFFFFFFWDTTHWASYFREGLVGLIVPVYRAQLFGPRPKITARFPEEMGARVPLGSNPNKDGGGR